MNIADLKRYKEELLKEPCFIPYGGDNYIKLSAIDAHCELFIKFIELKLAQEALTRRK